MKTNANLQQTESIQEQTEMLDEFLEQNYEFRHNLLSDKYEMRERRKDGEPVEFRPVTRETVNTIALRIKREGLELRSIRQCMEEHIYSEETPQFCPIRNYLESLPEWDGKDHVSMLFARIPGVTSQQKELLATWLRSCVAHWAGIDTIHANECVVTLIGSQGCGKSTFCARLLPPSLRMYYLDHINLGNKNDKEMALTGNLIVNIDELDQIRHSQQAELKQTLSKSTVNGRPIYGRTQVQRRRYASFVSTTNNLRPLNDCTGSRRFLCVQIPDGNIIDNCGEIDYGQLYAQVLREINVEEKRYWFTNAQMALIERNNIAYQRVINMESMVEFCFRRPEDDESVSPMYIKEIVSRLKSEFPDISSSKGLFVSVGRTLKGLGYERKTMRQGNVYYIIPKLKEAV